MDPDQDGEGPQQGGAEVDRQGGEDVEVQAILADLRQAGSKVRWSQRSEVRVTSLQTRSEVRVTSLQTGSEVNVKSLQTASRGLSYRPYRCPNNIY